MYLAEVSRCRIRRRLLGRQLPNGMVLPVPLGDGVDRIIVVPDAVPAHQHKRAVTFYDDVQRHLSGLVTGQDIRYDVGSGEHPLLGRRVPAPRSPPA
jgi:hypothetical protein